MRRSGEGEKGRYLPWSKEEEGVYIFWMKQVPVLWPLFFILHLCWSIQQWDKLTLLHKWKTPPTQQRLKNNKVYECHPDVKLRNIYLQDFKLIFHMTYKQREMNSLPVILTYFMQGGEKCLLFAITSLLIQLWIAQFQNEKKIWYTAEIHVSRKCTLKDHFFETFLILCRIKNKIIFHNLQPNTNQDGDECGILF